MKLIAGLGNPDEKYENTRHNVGFMVADKLAETIGAKFNQSMKRAKIASVFYKGEKIIIIKPQTYMNLSGESVAPIADYFRIPKEDILIVVDDVNLSLGKLRMRKSGSAGGHNGLKSVILNLATEEFPRLRIGVGAPAADINGEKDMINHVLGRFSRDEEKAVEEMTEKGAEAALAFCTEGIDAAMNSFNGEGKEA